MSQVSQIFQNPRSNHAIFRPFNTGSPNDGLMAHISGLGRIARLDFERCGVAGEVIFAVEGDAAPTSQQDEEARIGALAYALKKLGNPEDAAEFMRCLNAFCDEGDARCRQTVASYYYGQIGERGVGVVLKEMALLAMQMASLNPVTEEVETVEVFGQRVDSSTVEVESDEDSKPSFFDQELKEIQRLVSGRRKAARLPDDYLSEWVNDLEAAFATVEELDEAFEHLEAMDQYDENGAIITMSSHERTVACGRIDPEFTVEDLPERAQHLAEELRRAYATGASLEEMLDDIDIQTKIIFPVKGKSEDGGRFYSHANPGLQHFCREALEAILADYQSDFHLTALRTNRSYRHFYNAIRRATDTGVIGEKMKQAFEARTAGSLPLKHFTALKTAAALHRERLQRAPLSKEARTLIREVGEATPSKLYYLSWAYFGDNIPTHPIHQLTTQERGRVWEALNTRKRAFEDAAISFVIACNPENIALLMISVHYYRLLRARCQRLSR